MKRVRFIVFLILSVSAVAISADESKPQLLDKDGVCKPITLGEGKINRLNVTLDALLHLELPFKPFDVIVGAEPMWTKLWSVGHNHVWLKARSSLPQGQTTSLTIIDENLKSHNFVLNRRRNPGYTCATAKVDPQLERQKRWDAYRSPEKQQIARLNSRIREQAKLHSRREAAIKKQATEYIKAETARRYTNYTWSQKGRLFVGKENIVRSVMDDGVHTYIGLNDTSFGLLSVSGLHGEDEHAVQFTYDPDLKQYTIVGVYDQLVLKYKDSNVTIDRKGAGENG